MATTRKSTTTRRTKTTPNKKVEPNITYVLDDDGYFVLDLYDYGENVSAKLTCCDKFICYGRVVMSDEKKEAFVSFPSYKTKDGNYKSQAFFIDSDIVKTMNESVTDYCYN